MDNKPTTEVRSLMGFIANLLRSINMDLKIVKTITKQRSFLFCFQIKFVPLKCGFKYSISFVYNS